jgi:hypothetical protein
VAKRSFSSHPINDEITTRRYRVLTYIEWITIMRVELEATRGMGSS